MASNRIRNVRLAPTILALAALALTLGGKAAVADWRDWLQKAIPSSDGGLADSEVARGLRAALERGTAVAVARLGREGGYLQRPEVKIPLPGPAERIGSTLRAVGQGERVDAFVTSMNEAATAAVPEAGAILREAVTSMTVDDAKAILTGPDDAATRYLRKTSGERIAARMRPVIEEKTASVGVTAAWKDMVASAGPLASAIGGDAVDLDGYVTEKALDGMFFMIAAEEKRIRENPAARTSDLLRSVFGDDAGR